MRNVTKDIMMKKQKGVVQHDQALRRTGYISIINGRSINRKLIHE